MSGNKTQFQLAVDIIHFKSISFPEILFLYAQISFGKMLNKNVHEGVIEKHEIACGRINDLILSQ